ncbi:MAG: hypothetical protein HY820_24880 [Acidobacteria bacterium]|nr:hypothetical protein [Acidobacteriota bacterium]
MTRLMLAVLLATHLLAQTTEAMFEPKNLTGDRANRAIRFVSDIMGARTHILWEPVLRQVSIRGSKDDVALALDLLRKYDVPEPKRPEQRTHLIEYTIYLVGAYNSPTPRGGALPADVDVAVKQMKGTLGYKAYRLLDTIPISTRNSGSDTAISGLLPAQAMGSSAKYFFRTGLGSPRVMEDGKTVNTPDFHFYVSIPVKPEEKPGEVGIRTDILVKEGQKIVLGKIRLDNIGDDAFFLVVTVNVL